MRHSFADIGETVAEHLGLPPGRHGNPSTGHRREMPELPEVETVRRGLQPVIEGARIVAVETRRPDLRFPFPRNFAERSRTAVTALGRRAKYLIAHLEGGPVLICHLGMSGSFRIEEGGTRRRRRLPPRTLEARGA